MSELLRKIAYYVTWLDAEAKERHQTAVDTTPFGHLYQADTHSAEVISDKWVRLVEVSYDQEGKPHHRMVCGFVALVDYTCKGLGDVKAGHVYNQHGWKRAARTLKQVQLFDPPADFEGPQPEKPVRKPRTKLLPSSIKKEIAEGLDIPKIRLFVHWDRGLWLEITITDTTEEEMDTVREYALQHRDRIGIETGIADGDGSRPINERYDKLRVSANGYHEDGIPDTHEAIEILNKMR